MSSNELSLFNTREYAIGSPLNRNNFESLEFAQSLTGTNEAYFSYFLHTDQIRSYADAQKTLQGTYTAKGYKGIVAAYRILIDIDVKDDLQKAHTVTRDLLSRLKISFGIPASSLRCKFSGSKGFHIEIPAELFGGFEPSASMPAVHKTMVIRLCKDFDEYIDTSIYHTNALIRIENTINAKSGLYCIPLTVDEINSMSIEEIMDLAKQTRFLPIEPMELQPIDALVQLKKNALAPIPEAQTKTGNTEPSTSYAKPDPKNIDKLFKLCLAFNKIEEKSKAKTLITHKERVGLGTILPAFGDKGKDKVHQLLAGQANYDKDQTSYYMDAMQSSEYKPELCLTLCRRDNLCPAIRAINRRSPIAFAYTYDNAVDERPKKFIESYALDKIVAHYTDIIYSLIDQSFYRFADGVYTAIADSQIKTMLNDFLPFYYPKDLITNTHLNALVERLKSHSDVRYEGRFNTEMYRLNLRNGIFDLMTHTLTPHTPEFMSNIQLPFAYDAQAKSPVFDKFLESIFDSKDVEDYILKIWSYLLLPTYSFQKIFVWYGSGRNGKGVLSRTIEAMIGTANSAHEDIHELANGRFSAINLKDKLVNFSTELKTNELDLSMLKKLSGGDQIAADKKYKDKITFQNVARLIILANDLPRFSEIGQAITQRFEFIEFPKSFINEHADTRLDEKLRAELSGIFNRVIAMIPMIHDAKGAINFAGPKELESKKESMLSNLSTVIEFVNERCEKSGYSTRLQSLYEGYRAWAKSCGYSPLGKKNFRAVLQEVCKLKVESLTTDKNQVHVLGIQRIELRNMLAA